MKNIVFYVATVLIWGSTWLAIEFQLGEVPIEVSLFYRFSLAALIMWAYCLWKNLPMALSKKDHGFVALLAIFNFSFNYLILYWSQMYLSSAMTSIAFSTMLLMNIVNTRLFFGKPIEARIYVGAVVGVMGIVLLFWRDITEISLSNTTFLGVLLCLTGTLWASLGNMVNVRNSKNGVGILQGNAWGMLYGSVMLLLYIFVNGSAFTLTERPSYWVSLLYLSVFGTVIAFWCYYALLKNIGPEKASYVIVLFPLVAVVLGTLYEGFQWYQSTVVGFILVIFGNIIVLTPIHRIRQIIKLSPFVKQRRPI